MIKYAFVDPIAEVGIAVVSPKQLFIGIFEETTRSEGYVQCGIERANVSEDCLDELIRQIEQMTGHAEVDGDCNLRLFRWR